MNYVKSTTTSANEDVNALKDTIKDLQSRVSELENFQIEFSAQMFQLRTMCLSDNEMDIEYIGIPKVKLTRQTQQCIAPEHVNYDVEAPPSPTITPDHYHYDVEAPPSSPPVLIRQNAMFGGTADAGFDESVSDDSSSQSNSINGADAWITRERINEYKEDRWRRRMEDAGIELVSEKGTRVDNLGLVYPNDNDHFWCDNK
jgi:hypothetical protein